MNELEILKEPMALGEVFAESGIFKDVKTAAQAVVKIVAGRELGLSAIESMNAFYIVNDRITIYASAIAGLVKKSGKYDYKVIKLTDEECTIEFFYEKESVGAVTFTLKDAAKAGIVNKDVWKSYPKNMLFARAITNGARWFCPDALCSYQSTEEIMDLPKDTKTITINEEGEVIDAGKEDKKKL